MSPPAWGGRALREKSRLSPAAGKVLEGGVCVEVECNPKSIGEIRTTAISRGDQAGTAVGPAIAGALGNLTPLFAVLIALALLGEVPGGGQLAAMAVIFVGVLLIVGGPRKAPGGGFGWAVVFLLLAAFIRGGAQPVVKLGLEGWPSPFAATMIGYVASASTILLAGAVREGRSAFAVGKRGWAWFVPVGWLNGAALLAIYAALARGPVAVVAPLVACYPLATLGFGRLLLGSGGLTPAVGLGVAVTVAGVVLLLRA